MTLTRPLPGDPLSSSNGKPSTQIIDEAFDLVDAHEAVLAGPVFTNPEAFTSVAAPVVINACNSLTGWTVTNGANLSTNAIPGRTQITAELNTGPTDNPVLNSSLRWNAPAPITVGTNTSLDIGFYWGPQVYVNGVGNAGGNNNAPEMMAEIVVSDGVDFTGNTVIKRVPAHHTPGAMGAVLIPVHKLSTIRCVGVRLFRHSELSQWCPGIEMQVYGFQVLNWSPQTERQKALSGTGAKAAIVPASYVPDPTPIAAGIDKFSPYGRNAGDNKSALDLRPGHEIISNFNGIKYVRQYDDGLYEDGKPAGSNPVVLGGPNATLYFQYSDLEPGETLMFPANARIYLRPLFGDHIIGKHNVTLDGNGSYLFVDETGVGSNLVIRDCTDLTIKNFKCIALYPETTLGDAMPQVDTWIAAPARDTTAHTVTLSTQAHAVEVGQLGAYHLDMDGNLSMDITLARTGSKTQPNTSDCCIEMVDENAPAQPGLAVQATEGPIAAGLYYYRCTYIDSEGQETGLGDWNRITLPTSSRVTVTVPVAPFNAGEAPIVARRIYRTWSTTTYPTLDINPWDYQNYTCVATINDNVTTTYRDSLPSRQAMGVAPTATFTAVDGGAGNVPVGTYTYWVTTINSAGGETMVFNNDSATSKTVTTTGKVNLAGLPTTGAIARRIYRVAGGFSFSSMKGAYLVGEQRVADALWAGGTFVDNNQAVSGLDHIPWSYTQFEEQPCNAPNMVYPILLTGGTTPTVYNVKINPRHTRWMDRRYTPVLRKTRFEAVNIVVYSGTQYCRRISFTDSAWFSIQDGCNNVKFENVDVIGFNGDFAQVAMHENGRSNNTVFKNCNSIMNARQGFSVVGGHDVVFDGCKIISPGRSGVDIEPFGLGWEQTTRITFRDCEFRAGGSGNMVQSSTTVDELIVDNCRFYTSYGMGGQQAINVPGGQQMSITNVYAPWMGIGVSGVRDVWINGVVCSSMAVSPGIVGDNLGKVTYGGGGAVMNVKLNALHTAAPFSVGSPNVFVANITENRVAPSGLQTYTLAQYEIGTNLGGPFNVAGNRAVMMDPGMFADRFPTSYKGVNAGKLDFPIGLDVQAHSVVNVRGVSSTNVRPNNHRISAAVPAGATSVTIPFPTKTYEDWTAINDLTAYSRAASGSYPAGSLAAATYYYAYSTRSAEQGPRPNSRAASVVVGGANNATRVTLKGVWGTTTHVEGITVYRGTAAGVYGTRFDVIPTSDPHALGVRKIGVDWFLTLMDFGPQVTVTSPISGDTPSTGYDLLYGITSTTNYIGSAALSGSNWVPSADQTGYEADLNYTVTTDASWPTTIGVTKTVAGVTLNFGVACPVGGGTVSCMIGR